MPAFVPRHQKSLYAKMVQVSIPRPALNKRKRERRASVVSNRSIINLAPNQAALPFHARPSTI